MECAMERLKQAFLVISPLLWQKVSQFTISAVLSKTSDCCYNYESIKLGEGRVSPSSHFSLSRKFIKFKAEFSLVWGPGPDMHIGPQTGSEATNRRVFFIVIQVTYMCTVHGKDSVST